MNYFAYGSCMDPDSFSYTVDPRYFEVVGAAVLRDYTLAFTLYSGNRDGGVADVIPSSGDYVEGVLYNLRSEALPPLDEREGVSVGLYEQQTIAVECNNNTIEAMTYMVVQKSPVEIPPSTAYAQLIYNGAVQYLSFSYRKKLVKSWNKKFGMDTYNLFERTSP